MAKQRRWGRLPKLGASREKDYGILSPVNGGHVGWLRWVIWGGLFIAAIGFVALPWLVVLLDQWVWGDHYAKASDRADVENGIRVLAIGSAGASLALIGTLHTVNATRRGQRTDAFVHAIDQVSSVDAADARVGGIYGLERLARESPDDRPAILEVLMAFLKRHAVTVSDTGGEAGSLATAADVLAAFAVICRVSTAGVRSGSFDLSGLVLRGARLDDVALYDLALGQVDLSNGEFSTVRFGNTHIGGARFREARLERCDLHDASTGLRGRSPKLAPTIVDFTHARIADTRLPASFSADFTNAHLWNISFRDVWSERMKIDVGKRAGASTFRGAGLWNVDFTDAFDPSNPPDFTGAEANEKTVWPAGFDPERAGVVIARGAVGRVLP